jgi:hypothetical protein
MAPLVTASVIGESSRIPSGAESGDAVRNCRKASAQDSIAAVTVADEFEVWFDKGVTDGLPVVPPTRERVERMLAGTGRSRDELLGEMPPN